MKPSSTASRIRTVSLPLLRLDTRSADDSAPLRDLGLDVGGEVLGRAARRLEALGAEPLAHVRRGEHLHDLAVQAVDNGTRRLCRREHAIPSGCLVALDAGFG